MRANWMDFFCHYSKNYTPHVTTIQWNIAPLWIALGQLKLKPIYTTTFRTSKWGQSHYIRLAV